ncbi:MAG TPA: hypothetical protein VIC59_04265 [Gemmatimonadota bacterium]|jgi:hypothetical protein
MKPRRVEPLWHVVSPDGGLLVEVATGDRGYCARRPGEPWCSGFGIATVARDAVHDVAALLAATDAGNRLRPGRTP